MQPTLLEQFEATDDHGNTHTVQIWQTHHDTSSLDGRSSIPSAKIPTTSRGQKLMRIDDDTFRIAQTGAVIRRA